MKKILAICLLTGLFLLNPIKVSAEVTWTETFPAGEAANKNYWNTGIDGDGSFLMSSTDNGRIYISSDGGQTWTETFPAGVGLNGYWKLAADDDGSNLIVARDGGRVYLSSNSGQTWTETFPTGVVQNGNWLKVTTDNDGSTLAATTYNGRIYISTNGGQTWAQTHPTGVAENKEWSGISMNADGSKMITSVYAGRVYLSNNSGQSWTETYPTGNIENKLWSFSPTISDDGLVMFTAEEGGRVYKTINGGTSWTEVVPTGTPADYYWYQMAADGDGSRVMTSTAYTANDRTYISEDSGNSWVAALPAGVEEDRGYSVNISRDGSRALIVDYTKAYIGTFAEEIVPTPSSTTTSVLAQIIESTPESPPNPNIIPGWALPIMVGPNFTGLHGFIPNAHISSDESRLASVFIDRNTHHDDLNIHHSDFNWMNILMFWNNPDEVKLPWAQGFNAVSEISKIEAKSSFNGYPVEATDNPYIILLGYDPNKLGNIPKEKLRIAKFNQDTKKWETINNPYVYPNGKVATTTNKFGYFSVVYPRSLWGQ